MSDDLEARFREMVREMHEMMDADARMTPAEREAKERERERKAEREQAEEDAAEERRYLEARKKRVRSSILALMRDPTCRVPQRVLDVLRKGEEQDTEALTKLRRWLGTGESFLALIGPTDSGKTFAATWLRVHLGGLAVVARDVADAYAYTHQESREMRRRMESAHVLVVDEMGTERDEAAAAAGIFELVDARVRGTLQTILVGNLTAPQFVARYGERTLGRIGQSGSIIQVATTGLRRLT